MNQPNVNTGLLVANDTPIKIYLDGFDVLDFLRTAKIIRMHGGSVSKPSYDTLILTPPNRQPSSKFIQFSADWLYDSIKHNTRQDVGKYLLPTAPLDAPDAPAIQTELKRSPLQEKTYDSSGFDERSEDQEVSADEESLDDAETDDDSSASTVTSMTSLADEQPPRSPPQLEATYDRPTAEPATTSDTPEVIREEIVENSAPSEVDVLNDEAELPKASNEETSLCVSHPPDDQRHLYALVNGCWRFRGTTLEFEKVPQITLDHHFSPESATPTPAPEASASEAQRRAAVRARRKRIHPMMMVSKRSRKRPRTDPLPKIRYSSAEDQKIIQYLIEHDAISMVDGHSVWDDMAREEKSLRGRSGASLKYRFTTNLKYNFRQHTDDPAALKQFEAVAANSRPTEK